MVQETKKPDTKPKKKEFDDGMKNTFQSDEPLGLMSKETKSDKKDSTSPRRRYRKGNRPLMKKNRKKMASNPTTTKITLESSINATPSEVG